MCVRESWSGAGLAATLNGGESPIAAVADLRWRQRSMAAVAVKGGQQRWIFGCGGGIWRRSTTINGSGGSPVAAVVTVGLRWQCDGV
ncbi:hypothetical protein Q3G72_021174 [Acer saccharum]|nr:hypothetical protein Q3G72_021174 [Acer saccharum]